MLQVTIADDSLTQQMTAENTGDEAFDLTAALHTYFKVSDIAKVSICNPLLHSLASMPSHVLTLL